MARPLKSGVDYFSLDVAVDGKFELIEAEFGLTGFAVVVKLFQRIYGGQGYYCEWTEEVALLFGRNIGTGGNVVSEIVSAAIRRGIFDRNLHDKYHILTSRGIQKRYFEAVSRRKQIEVNESYLLVNVAQICENVNILRVNVNINPENVNHNPQSKVKESKVYTLSSGNESPDMTAKKYPADSRPYKIAVYLNKKLEENNPSRLPVSEQRLQAWANSARLMLERDKRSPESIRRLIDFSQADAFWKSNILSIPKLREKFEQLDLKEKAAKSEPKREWNELD